MTSILTFLTTKWRWLAVPLGVVFATLLLTVTVQWGLALYARHQLITEQTEAEQRVAQRQAAAAARYRAYQLDSADRAATRRVLEEELTTLRHQDATIDSLRPVRVVLPAVPPRL